MMRMTRPVLATVLVHMLLGGTAVAADEDGRKARIQEFLSRMGKSTPTVSVRNVGSIVDIHIQGAFRAPSSSPEPGERARAFLEDGGVARELGFVGRCRVRDVNDTHPRGPVAVRFDFYEGDAQIGGAEAIVHVAGDEITYIGGTYPVRSPIKARTAAGSIIAVEQVRSIVLDRLYEKGWNPDKPWTRHFQTDSHHGEPYDPVTEIKISLLIPHEGPDLVYDVNTTGAGYGFWVDAHTGKIVREDSPQPDMGVGIP